MSMTVKDVIKWLQTLPADDAIYIDESGLSLLSEKDDEAYLEVGGQHMETVECFKCHKFKFIDEYKISDVTGSRVCPECGYEGGKLSPGDSGEHQDEWDSLFDEDEADEDDDSIFEDDEEDENFEDIEDEDDDEDDDWPTEED